MRISGLNSGLDTEQIIKDIMTAQRIPVDRVFQKKVQAEWKRDAYRDVNMKLSRFDSFIFDMKLTGTFQRNVATSSRTDILTVNASGSAHSGTYDLEVKQLAASAQFVSKDVTLVAGETFQVGTSAENMMEITVGEGDTLATIAKTINDNKDLGISAYAHGNRISFTTKATGKEAKIEGKGKFYDIFWEINDESPEEGAKYTAGQDAKVIVNGLETSHSSNSFDLNGVTVNLLEAKEGVKVRVEVRHDVDAVVDKIKEFVNMYNELVDELNLSLREEVYRDFPPLTDAQRAELSDKEIEMWEEKAKSGLLRADSIVSGILSEMRMALGAAVQGEEGSITLADIGITTGSWYEYGRLNINESKLRSAVEEDPDAVQRLFAQDSAETSGKGIARRLEDVLDKGKERLNKTAGRAGAAYDDSFYGERIRDYESRLSAMEERLLRYEESQWRKFTAMERVLGQLYAQGDWLTQQLFAMQG